MAAPSTQQITGKTPMIGFTALEAIANALRSEETETPIAEVEEVEGETGEVEAVVTSDPGMEVGASGTALSSYTNPAIGAALTVGGVAGYCIEARISRTPTLARFACKTRKEDSITTVA